MLPLGASFENWLSLLGSFSHPSGLPGHTPSRGPSISPSVFTVINFPKERDLFLKAELPGVRTSIIQRLSVALSDVLLRLLCVSVGAMLPIAQLGGD